jgi:hypothetical protein
VTEGAVHGSPHSRVNDEVLDRSRFMGEELL